MSSSRTMYVTDHRQHVREHNSGMPKMVGTHHNVPDWPTERILKVYGIASHLKVEIHTFVDGKPSLTIIQEGSMR